MTNACAHHTFLDRPLYAESAVTAHRLDVNPEAQLFHVTDSGATEAEYLDLISALVGVFKPTHLMETGTWNGDGAACLVRAALPDSVILTFCDQPLGDDVQTGLRELADSSRSDVRFVHANTNALMADDADGTWARLSEGKATFAFLDSSIPDRAREFDYLSDPRNGVLDFTRPLCVCIHDMSRYRHPHDSDSNHLANALATVSDLCAERGWQQMRFHQSRGLLVLTKYPEATGIDGECILPRTLISPHDLGSHTRGNDPYLITDYYPVLHDIVKRQQPKRVLEIGVRYGYSLATILDASADTLEAVYALDLPQDNTNGFPHGGEPGAYKQAQASLRQVYEQTQWLHMQKLTFFEADSQLLQDLPEEVSNLDLAYIDGDRSIEGCLHDIELVLPRISDGGMILVNDVDWCALRSPVEDWAQEHKFASTYHPDSSGRGRIAIPIRRS